MPNEFNLATPLANNPNITAIIQVVREELALIDFTKLLVYAFEIVDESLIDVLLEQFDMKGYNGEILADSVQAKRELLKSAFELHILKGTPGGIREVVKRLGFVDIKIIEGWENFDDGSPEPAVNSWSHFKVVYMLPDGREVTNLTAVDLAGLLGNYKNARSILANFSFGLPRTEALFITETVNLTIINV